MNPAQDARENLVTLLRARADQMDRGTFSFSPIHLRQAANEIESLGLIAEAAKDVWAVASAKGQLFSSDENSSDVLVGFFTPAWVMNNLGKAMVQR